MRNEELDNLRHSLSSSLAPHPACPQPPTEEIKCREVAPPATYDLAVTRLSETGGPLFSPIAAGRFLLIMSQKQASGCLHA